MLLTWTHTLHVILRKSRLIGKDPEVDRRQEETGTTEDEMLGWHH